MQSISRLQGKLIDLKMEYKKETRLYEEKTGETKTMRTKEDENDYRYFS